MPRSEGLAITTIGLVTLLVALLAWHDDPASAQSTAAGTTIVVNTAQDKSNAGGDCSLREAIRAAR